MVFQVLLALLFIFILIAIGIALLIYVPSLPLFISAWFVEIFGEVDASSALPLLFGAIFVGYGLWNVSENQIVPTGDGFIILLFGFVLVLVGGGMFGNAWESMQAEQIYTARTSNIISSSPCADYAIACLMEDSTRYSSQLGTTIFAEIVWYGGLVISYSGFKEKYWRHKEDNRSTEDHTQQWD